MALDRSVPNSVHTEHLSVLLTARIFTNSEITESGTDNHSCCFFLFFFSLNMDERFEQKQFSSYVCS